MNKTLAEAATFVDELLAFPIPPVFQVFLLPPHTALASITESGARGLSHPAGRSKNAHWAPEVADRRDLDEDGKDAGATLIEIGHSDRASISAKPIAQSH